MFASLERCCYVERKCSFNCVQLASAWQWRGLHVASLERCCCVERKCSFNCVQLASEWQCFA
jgi:hypothetical protein